MTTTAPPPVLQHKNLAVAGFKVVNDEEGIVEAFVSGIGNKDSVGDIIQPGAFARSLKRRTPKGVWSHNWDLPVSKTLAIEEVSAGDSRLPVKMKTAGIGGLFVRTQFNLKTQRGREAYEDVKFYGEESEWSIGYLTIDQEYSKELGANLLKEIELFEYSPVLFGANPLTATVGIKAQGGKVEVRMAGIDDPALVKAVEDLVKTAVADDGKGDHSQAEYEAAAGDAEKTEEAQGETEAEDDKEQAVGDKVDEKDGEEAMERKAIPGSFEERMGWIMDGLSAEVEDGYVFPIATFDSTLVYYEYSFVDGEERFWQADYTLSAEGEFTLGDKVEVDVVEVVVAKAAMAQAQTKGLEVVLEEKSGGETGEIEVKAGRVLSSKNVDKLKSAQDAIQQVLDSAGSTDEGDQDEKAAEVETKADRREEAIAALVAAGFDEAEAKTMVAVVPPVTEATAESGEEANPEGEVEGEGSEEEAPVDETETDKDAVQDAEASSESEADDATAPHEFQAPEGQGGDASAACTVCGEGIDGAAHESAPANEEKTIALSAVDLAEIEALLAEVG